MKTSSASKILEKDLKMKSRFAFLVLMVFAMLIVLCSAGMAETNGTIGDLTWVLNDSGTLTISGTGVVASGFSELDGKENVKRIVMEEGITEITNLAFSDYKNVEEISVPNSVVSIGNNIVYGCSKLTGIVLSDNITSIEKRAFSWTSAKLYAKINSTTAKTLGKSDYAFRTQGGNYDLRYIYSGEEEIGLSLEKVDADTNSVVIPDGVTMIGSNPFSYRKNIVNVSVPGSVRSISSKAFSSMEYSIVFLGNAPDMAEDAFDKAMILAHYPKDGEGWAEVILKQFGASWIQWVNGEEGTTPDTERDTTEELEPEETNNEEAQNYFTWSHPVRSNLIKQNDGTWLRVEQANNVVVVEEYTQDLTISWRKTFQMELPLWGGYFHGAQYHYLVFGQGNPDEDNEKEIMRIVRYTANWKRIDAASVKGANTTVPFDAGSLRMTESENYLFVHTNHTMYKSSDGLNHQSNMSYKIYIPTMSVIRRSVQEANQGDYVSHSFNQFVIRDENNIIKVDHGDAYPRSVLLQIFEDATETLGSGSRKSVNVLKLPAKQVIIILEFPLAVWKVQPPII